MAARRRPRMSTGAGKLDTFQLRFKAHIQRRQLKLLMSVPGGVRGRPERRRGAVDADEDRPRPVAAELRHRLGARFEFLGAHGSLQQTERSPFT